MLGQINVNQTGNEITRYYDNCSQHNKSGVAGDEADEKDDEEGDVDGTTIKSSIQAVEGIKAKMEDGLRVLQSHLRHLSGSCSLPNMSHVPVQHMGQQSIN